MAPARLPQAAASRGGPPSWPRPPLPPLCPAPSWHPRAPAPTPAPRSQRGCRDWRGGPKTERGPPNRRAAAAATGRFERGSVEAAAAPHPGQAVAQPFLQRGGPGEGALRGRGVPGVVPRLRGERRRVREQWGREREQRERFEGGRGGQGPHLAGVPAERHEAPSDGEEEGGAEEAQEVSVGAEERD